MNKKGFTLVELLAIVILLGLVFGLSYPNIVKQIENKNDEIDKYTLELIYSAADSYVKKNNITDVGSTFCVEISKLNSENMIPVDVDKYLDKVVKVKIGKNGINSKMILESCDEYIVITYDANGGSISPATRTVKYGKSINFDTPTKEGYTFDGWYTELENGNKVTNKTKWKKESTIYAHWIIDTYTITYDANGGIVEPSDSKINYNEKLKLPTPTKEGYTFDGWYTEKLGGIKVDDDTIWSADQTIYARYTVKTYVITLDPVGGNIDKMELSVNYNEKLELPQPTKEGYSFDGWYTEINGGELITNETKWTSSQTIYAHWK